MNYARRPRAYSATVRDNTTSAGYIVWSDDGLRLSYKHFELDLPHFRWFLRDQVSEVQRHLRRLLFSSKAEDEADSEGESKGKVEGESKGKVEGDGYGLPCSSVYGAERARTRPTCIPRVCVRGLKDNPSCSAVGWHRHLGEFEAEEVIKHVKPTAEETSSNKNVGETRERT
jgi:hypothetical protein